VGDDCRKCGMADEAEIGAGHAGADANETEGGSVAGFVVDYEVEAVVRMTCIIASGRWWSCPGRGPRC
jgi:hypothetical protein